MKGHPCPPEEAPRHPVRGWMVEELESRGFRIRLQKKRPTDSQLVKILNQEHGFRIGEKDDEDADNNAR
jgi:hypothetical protein